MSVSEELGDLEPGSSTKGTKPARVEGLELMHMGFDTHLVGEDPDGRTVTVTLIPPMGTGAPQSQTVAPDLPRRRRRRVRVTVRHERRAGGLLVMEPRSA